MALSRTGVAPIDDRLTLTALAAAFLASGFAALIDQTVWQRILGIFAGSDAVTAAIVVGAFLMGLGLGSLAAGLVADKLSARQAALAFIACEIGVAAFTLLSKPFLYDWLALQIGPEIKSPLLIFLISFSGMLLPTFLMGCSLPFLSRAAVTGLDGAAQRIGLLYGLNTLGAGVGALAAGWWLAGTFGFEATLWIAAGSNLLAAGLTLAVMGNLSSVKPSEAARGPDAPSTGASDPWLIQRWSALVFVSGFIIVGLEIAWVRLLGVFMQGSAYAFPSILAVFLVADGLGILAATRWVDRVREPRSAFVLIQALAVAIAALTVTLLYAALEWGGLARWVGSEAVRFRGDGFIVALILVLVVVAPPSFLMGLSFPFAQKAVQKDFASVGRRVGYVQLANIMGNAAGSLCVGLISLQLLGMIGTLMALGIGAVLLALAEARRASDQWRVRSMLGGGAVAATLALLPSNDAYWRAQHLVRPADVAYVAENRSGLAVLRLRDGAGPMFIGGFSQSDVPFATWHTLLGVLGPLTHPNPKDVLVIGVGVGGTPHGAGVRPETEHIRAIELVSPVYAVMDAYAAQNPKSAIAAMRRDPRYSWVAGDGRRDVFVGGRRYDVIQADAVLPESSMSGMLYSQEFFELARKSLKEGGIFVQWAPTQRTVDTFLSVFPHAVRLGNFGVLIGSNEPIAFDPDALTAALRSPAVAAHIRAGGTDVAALLPMIQGKPIIWTPSSPRVADVNRDLHPRDEFYFSRSR
ncbi:MAG: fused MFS/spermidine synthase [Elsteraceae bacterium]